MFAATPLRPFGRKDPPTPLPDAATTFEPLLKRELARRLFLVCGIFFVTMWLVSLVPAFDQRGPPLGVLGHLVATTLTSLLALGIGGVPPLVLRGRAVSEKFPYFPTRAETFLARVSNASTWRTLAFFFASGFFLALLHVALLNLSDWEDSKLSILVPTRRNAFRLNERFFYLAFFNASLGLVYASRDLVRQRELVKWTRSEDQPDLAILSTSSVILGCLSAVLNIKAIISTTIITLMHMLLFPIWYHLFRMFALPILRNLPLISGVARPLFHGFGRTWTVDVPWLRLLTLGFKTSLGWELVECGFDYWVTKPIAASHRTPNPNQMLVAGLHSRDRYFKHHAYLELSALASSQLSVASARRTALFTDTKTSPTLWNALLHEILVTLGRDYQCLLRRGKPPPPAPTSTPAPATPRTKKIQSTPLIRQAIVKPSPRSLFDSLASDGEVTQAPTSTTTAPESVKIPSVFLPSTPPGTQPTKQTIPAGTAKTTETKKNAEFNKLPLLQKIRAGRKAVLLGVLQWVEKELPREWKVKEWWTDVRVKRQAQACVPDGVLDIIGIDVLSHLIASSLKEDTLGNVQRDIPRVLEAFLSFLAAAEAFQAELEKKIPPSSGTSQEEQDGGADVHTVATRDVACAIEVVLPLIQALRAGVGLITMTFDNRLSVYKFPPITAARLQTYMDYL